LLRNTERSDPRIAVSCENGSFLAIPTVRSEELDSTAALPERVSSDPTTKSD
jgi:hypothetical protein